MYSSANDDELVAYRVAHVGALSRAGLHVCSVYDILDCIAARYKTKRSIKDRFYCTLGKDFVVLISVFFCTEVLELSPYI